MPQWLLSAIFAVEFLGESIIWKEMKLKFVLAMVTALPLAFMACKKEQGPNPGKDATVRIAVLLPDGTPVPGAEVRVYDEAGGKALEKNPFAAPLETLTAGADGVVQYTMRVDRWFSGAKQRYVTFAVLQGTGDNYHLWSVGRTVEVGRSQRAEIRLEGLDEKLGVPSDPGPVSLRVSRQPDKLVYCLGEPLDLTGLEVMGRYEDDKEQAVEVTPAQVKGFSSERPAGELELTIEVGDRETSFTVTVLPVRVENGVLTEVWPEADEIVLPEIVREIPEKAFAARRIKSLKLNEGLRTIGEMAFCGASVPEIILPASLEQLGDHAFYHCAGLTRVDMSRTQLAALPKNLFAYADIEQIVWPARLAEIGTQAFLGTGRLKRVEIPETVRKIGFEAFRESAVESVVLPDGVTEIAGRAFYLCASLVEVSVHGASGDTADGALRGSCFVGCPSLERLAIPRSIRTLEQGLLSGNTRVSSIVIPAGVGEIAFGAFDNTRIREVRVEAATPPVAGLILDQWYGFPKDVEKIIVPAGTADAYKKAAGWSRFADRIE